MEYYVLQPEVPGGFGKDTILSDEEYPNGAKKVIYLDYEFFGWLGDDLLETTPCFIVSENLYNFLKKNYHNEIKFSEIKKQ